MNKEINESISKLKENYGLEEAKELIDRILSAYSDKCKIVFFEDNAEITDSYLVNKMHDRQLVCEIIRRTGITDRDYEDMSAEWEFHNVSYNMHFKRESAKDVNLDYAGDPRKSVRTATAVFKAIKAE